MNVGYADDVSLSQTLLVAVADTDKTVEEEAFQLDDWASDYKMTLNGMKSQLLQIFFSRTVPVPPTLSLGGGNQCHALSQPKALVLSWTAN